MSGPRRSWMAPQNWSREMRPKLIVSASVLVDVRLNQVCAQALQKRFSRFSMLCPLNSTSNRQQKQKVVFCVILSDRGRYHAGHTSSIMLCIVRKHIPRASCI